MWVNLKDEVESYKEEIVVKKKIFKKKDMENKVIMRGKKHENKQRVFSSMKVNYEKPIEVNNELKLNVDEQQGNIKHFKKKCYTDEEDEA